MHNLSKKDCALFFFREHSPYMYLLRLGRRACESSSTFFPQRKERLPFLQYSYHNPAITLGVFLTGRMNGKDAGMYMIFQVIGAIIGSAILFALVSTGAHDGPTATGSNGFGDGEMLQAFIAEAVFTFIFVLVVLGSTDPKKGAGNLAGLAIGLTLVLVHIVCIPITGTSVNPARSIAPALFQGGEALSQLWLFIIAPFVGAALSAVVWNYLGDKK